VAEHDKAESQPSSQANDEESREQRRGSEGVLKCAQHDDEVAEATQEWSCFGLFSCGTSQLGAIFRLEPVSAPAEGVATDETEAGWSESPRHAA